MLSHLSLLTVISLVLRGSASPVSLETRSGGFSMPLTKVVDITSGHNLVQSGRLRAQNFLDGPAGRASKRQTEPVVNEAVTYLATIAVGANNQTFNLIVDTGSSNTWVGAAAGYEPSSTSTDTFNVAEVAYGSGMFVGVEYNDRIALTDEMVIHNQSIGTAFITQGFQGVDGILGLGPTNLTAGTVQGSDVVPTVTDSLFKEGTISAQVVGISFEPTTEEEVTNGELFFGGADDKKFTGEITYTPKETEYWGITQSISYGGTTILSNSTGIVDSGTTLLYLPTDTLNTYIATTGGVLDGDTGLYQITAEQYANLESMVFTIGGTDFELTPNAQIWPRSLNEYIGGSADAIYLVAADIGTGNDFDFVNGYVFLERFYTVYDTTNSRVGLATTSFTNAESN